MSSSWNNRRNKRFYGPDCKLCRSAKRRADDGAKVRDSERKRRRYVEDASYRERIRVNNIRHRYGLPPERFAAILVDQDGLCAICRTSEPGPKGWNVDHDHDCCAGIGSCGKCVRGLLCNKCNLAIGLLADDPDVLMRAHDYLIARRSVPA